MQKFLVLYIASHEGMDAWMARPEAERKEEDEKMMREWDEWTEAHKGMLRESFGTGRPKRITGSGIEDARNDVMVYSIVEAESLEAAAAIFKDHPHFGIPNASIEVMPLKSFEEETTGM